LDRSLFCGVVLIYNTVSVSVITRREEVGALRAVGAGRLMVLALFLGEALLLTIIGTIVGLGLGRVMAGAAVQITATTVETFYIASAATETVARHALGGGEIALAFAVALPLALAASAVPALEASRVRPIEAMRGAERLKRTLKPPVKLLVMSLALLALAYGFSWFDLVNGLPIFGYAAAVALMFAGALIVPNVLWLGCGIINRWVARVFGTSGVEVKLASANLRASIQRVSISVAALAVALAMMVAVSIMIGSFRETVSYWVGQTMVADIYARPVTRSATTDEGEISNEAIAVARADQQVAAVYPFTTQQLSYLDEPITVGATSDIFGTDVCCSIAADARDRLRESIGRDLVTVNELRCVRSAWAIN
jgi:putative ABC transport system permease protein